MVDSERAVIDETTAGLLEAAGPQMYRRNAFRITGLPTYADRRTVRQRQQRITPALELGADVDLGHSLPVGLDDIRGAFDRILGDPRRRLVDELFWLWDADEDGSGGGDGGGNASGVGGNAVGGGSGGTQHGQGPSCDCPKSLHRDHDAAVRAHSAALDISADELSARWGDSEATRLWTEASRLWGQVLRRAVFWDHVRHRIAVLDDRQLDDSVVDTLRDAMPATLVKPLIELASTASNTADRLLLTKLAHGWPLVPSSLVEDQLEEAAAPHYESLRATAKRASSQLEGGDWDGAAAQAYEHALPALKELEALVPYARHRRTSTARNDIAVLLNNCATAATDALGPAANLKASKWFRTAGELATDPVTQQTIRTNREGLRDMMETFNSIETQVEQLVAAGRISLARTLLLNVKRQLAGGPGTEEIDQMLADLRDWPPGSYLTGSSGGNRTPGLGRKVFTLVMAVVLLLLLARALTGLFDNDDGDGTGARPGAGTVVLSATDADENDPVGGCIERESDWEIGAREVAVVPCEDAHWGEVVSYEPLISAESTYLTRTYPGADQAVALARFRCELRLARLGDEGEGLAVSYTVPPKEVWNTGVGSPLGAEYTTCVVHRADNGAMTEEDRVPLNITGGGAPALMDTFSQFVRDNAPVGSCVQTKKDLSAESIDLPIVPCEELHWAEIIGYPVLYEADSTHWPGNEVVYARAKAACEDLTKDSPSASMRLHVVYPAQDWWSGLDSPIYAMCAMSYPGDNSFGGGL
ncbi:septum formation family protein [Streptomyces sp. NPDC058653]|uniref:septum formation family protein n=1 Tax=Streptomyces sp. NPDC058653 TaxID=3346576 RepID=UPI00366247E2